MDIYFHVNKVFQERLASSMGLDKYQFTRIYKRNIIYADYNIHHNSIDICTYAGYILRVDCAKAEDSLEIW